MSILRGLAAAVSGRGTTRWPEGRTGAQFSAGCLVWLTGLVVLAVGTSVVEAAYQAHGKRDPFVPLLTASGQRIHPPGGDEGAATGVASVALQGIVYDPKTESYAILNGRVVRLGEAINGMTVTAITPTTVTVMMNGQPHRLTVQTSTTEEATTTP